MSDSHRPSSRLPGFYRLSQDERRAALVEAGWMTSEAAAHYASTGGALPADVADSMIENVIGRFELPIGVGANFVINGVDYVVPMVVEEPSIVAAVSHAAAIVRQAGGFEASSDRSVMTGQIQVVGLDDLHAAAQAVMAARDELLSAADALEPGMKRRGGGAIDLDVRPIEGPTRHARMLVVHLYVDACDAMGASGRCAVNANRTSATTMPAITESLKPTASASRRSRARRPP